MCVPSHPRLARDIGDWIDSEIAALDPGCFGLVMATGIISNTLFFLGERPWSDALFAVNAIAYPWLVALSIRRASHFRRQVWADLINPRLVFSFFTIVAGTCVIGVGLDLRGFVTLAAFMWLFALLAWLVLTYASFAVLTFLNTPQGAEVINGGWLLAIVGTEAVVVLGTSVAPAAGSAGSMVSLLIHVLWGVGLALYGIYITLFAYRLFFFGIEPDDITPVLWVVMGAAAITTNAGSTLTLTDSGIPILQSMRQFIDGVTLLTWALATWWIPLLLLLGIWKHGVRGIPLNYTPMLWSFVFPLGMYALASLRLSLAAGLPPLKAVSEAMIWVALAAWSMTGTGLALAAWRSFRMFSANSTRPA